MKTTLQDLSDRAGKLYESISAGLDEIRNTLLGVPMVMLFGEYRGYVGFVKEVTFDLHHAKKNGNINPTVFLSIPMKSDPTRSYWDRVDARSYWAFDQVRMLTESEVGSLSNGKRLAREYFQRTRLEKEHLKRSDKPREMWDRGHFSCNTRKVFGNSNPLMMTAEELDEHCRKAGVVWEELENNEIHVHGCGMECYCHGGKDNPNLRPRPE